MYQKILFILCLIGCQLNGCLVQDLMAQRQPAVENLQIQRNEQQVMVWFHLRLDALDLPSNRLIRLTPVLTKGDSACNLPSIRVAGTRQYIMQQRNKSKEQLIKRKNHSRQSFDYATSIPYKEWMNGSTLHLTQDFCGCGGQTIEQASIASQDWPMEKAEYEVRPTFAYLAPTVEKIKNREESGQAFLDFPVNKTIIYPNYRRNAKELDQIERTIDVIKNDTNTQIRRISIHGFASPEGSYANNTKLAQGRAEALKQYVGTHYQFADTLFDVTSTPEDWDGLATYIRRSDLPAKDQLLQLIASNQSEDAKEKKLRSIIGQPAYAHLLKEVYPSLRHSDYTVSYTVRAFQIEEAKQLLKTRPQLLSLNEMYQIASTYPTGSKEFNEVFETAVHLFPNDPTANLNAALTAMQEKRYERAARYLDKAGNSPEAEHARGVWYLLNDRLAEAEPLLKAAEEAGIPEATDNLREWEQRKEYLNSKQK
ncbi:protein containing Outer membrane protein, OmpA/MotB [gut metagenome]|uniref:Protein containing Outer membrane protein, OmpA/MotB n=1 Tax=gut metagenome TaxID=749906 RepID=J9GCP7_9ZZZZ